MAPVSCHICSFGDGVERARCKVRAFDWSGRTRFGTAATVGHDFVTR